MIQGYIRSDSHDTYTREEIEKLCRKMIGGHGTEIDVINCTHEIYMRTLTAGMILSVTYLVEVCKKNYFDVVNKYSTVYVGFIKIFSSI
jgi:diacylglycerol kinase family enzyme